MARPLIAIIRFTTLQIQRNTCPEVEDRVLNLYTMCATLAVELMQRFKRDIRLILPNGFVVLILKWAARCAI